MTQTEEYKVELEVYSGPLDLLLYLIRREEVDIYDIPISRITEQYMAHLETLEKLDPALVGDFLVLAATLMYIKSQMLLPQPSSEEEEEDPRWELVQQLLEYQKFKKAASALERLRKERGKKFARAVKPLKQSTSGGGEENLSMEEANPWELLNIYTRLLKETLLEMPAVITLEGTPVEEYMNHITERLRSEEILHFLELIPPPIKRVEIVGAFLALLELVRLLKARVRQESDMKDIEITRGAEFLPQ
ncbi:MAG TPA: segregation and condensation protein A [Candidatus Hypogeohydataceae bacterium YC41]